MHKPQLDRFHKGAHLEIHAYMSIVCTQKFLWDISKETLG
jgi:hypothetical protein